MLLEEGEDGGEGTFGFQALGLGRGGGGACPVDAGVVADADFSKAAILSRKEPGFGLGGSDG